MSAEFVFWCGLIVVVYTYLGYPVLLYIRALGRKRQQRSERSYTPTVTFVILAHNEEKVIRQKLENTLALAYPEDRLQIIVASDGCTDRTNEIVQQFKGRAVRLFPSPVRRGKVHMLNLVVPQCESEVVVLSDARQVYDREAVQRLVANFDDPTIGAVTGDLQFEDRLGCKTGEQIGSYWKYEKWIRRLQSAVGSTLVVTGAIYAIRRSLFRPLPSGVIADDLVLPMDIVMQGYRVVFDPAAKAYDHFPVSPKAEFRKRVRTIAGSYQYLARVPRALNPLQNPIWVDFFSHKVLRIMAPFVLVAILAANSTVTKWPYNLILGLQVSFYLLAGLGALLVNRKSLPMLVSMPYTFVMLNAVAGIAFVQVLLGGQTHLWEKQHEAEG